MQLFVQRARAVAPGFDPRGEELAATAAICAALDGLPLAIELAAARVRLYPPQALLPQLQARLPLLVGGPRNLPQRQQTLRATLDWSDALLSPDARDLFARLGVFAGPFDAAAAAAVCGTADPLAMTERLAELAGHSLLEVTPGLTPRFALLATVREYALARLAETGQADAVHERHLRHYLALATQARADLDGPQQGDWFDRLAADFANIRAALDWARPRAEAGSSYLEDGLRLATAAAPFWRRRGSHGRGRAAPGTPAGHRRRAPRGGPGHPGLGGPGSQHAGLLPRRLSRHRRARPRGPGTLHDARRPARAGLGAPLSSAKPPWPSATWPPPSRTSEPARTRRTGPRLVDRGGSVEHARAGQPIPRPLHRRHRATAARAAGLPGRRTIPTAPRPC